VHNAFKNLLTLLSSTSSLIKIHTVLSFMSFHRIQVYYHIGQVDWAQIWKTIK